MLTVDPLTYLTVQQALLRLPASFSCVHVFLRAHFVRACATRMRDASARAALTAATPSHHSPNLPPLHLTRSVADLEVGTKFERVLPESFPETLKEPEEIRKVVMCSGKL